MSSALEPGLHRITSPYLKDVETIVRELDTDIGLGLSSAQAQARLSRDGPNELRTKPAKPAWQYFLRQFHDPLVYLLLVAVAITLGSWLLMDGRDWPVDALVITLIVLANAFLGFFQEARSQRAVATLVNLTQSTSSAIRDGALRRIPSHQLVIGDLMVLSEGDSVGADARLVQANALRILEASLTGESEAVSKNTACPDTEVPLAERANMVFKGTAIVQGSGVGIVTAVGMATEVGAIAHLLDVTTEEVTPLQKEVREIGRMLGIAALVIATVVVGAVLILTPIDTVDDVLRVLLLGVSLAVAAVPEGLPAVLSLVLAFGMLRMARNKAIIKRLSSVETLGSASVICTDKTGTLTRSEMTIQQTMTASGKGVVSGVGYDPKGQIHYPDLPKGSGPVHCENVLLLRGGSLAGNAALMQKEDGTWVVQGDPTEAAFLVAERKLDAPPRSIKRFERVAEIPFTSDRKMMSALVIDHEHNDERLLISKGAPDVLLQHCTHVQVGKDIVPLTADLRAKAVADVNELSGAALRTLSVAYRPLAPGDEGAIGPSLETGLVFIGTVGMSDPPREEVAPAIAEAHQAGIRIIMITGDHPRTAARIAEDLGIIQAGGGALTGADLDKLDDAALAQAIESTSVYARVAPSHKLRIVDALQAQGHVVAMTGDGVNDAPALKSADIGIAMGITGTEVTRQAGEMILADDNFSTIVLAVREGRGILDNIRKFLRYLLSSNMGEVLTVFLAVVGAGVIGLVDERGGIILPLLANQILWINLITDAAPAIAMGFDPQNEDVMARSPRKPSDRIINTRMWAGVIEVGLVMALASLLTLDWMLPGGLIPGDASLVQARTGCFTVLVLAQLFNALSARSESNSAFIALFANRWLWGAIILAVILQIAVVHSSLLNKAFGTSALTLSQWGLCLAMASLVFWFIELRKLHLRLNNQKWVNLYITKHE
ncbi:calcium-translocating P-type ATPase/potassium/sodium efflux P-type ATPase,TIGR01523 [Pseudomonas sp. SJZ080]|uniref:cation-translocating P-type ATPase n=1 Tax=Pseudomonas sp. SJZ080 TaxID=2572888 RepID=UPI00119A14D2|nr:cation-translocating P-type ATPase [Pseudomonas sp. SJZ080]TWC55739.1 calcium-translocating P-type ATPase/potassium/sodium efflux P-type ATPase,TIGR01523 [Pseudomonas sp. SJZ080]